VTPEEEAAFRAKVAGGATLPPPEESFGARLKNSLGRVATNPAAQFAAGPMLGPALYAANKAGLVHAPRDPVSFARTDEGGNPVAQHAQVFASAPQLPEAQAVPALPGAGAGVSPGRLSLGGGGGGGGGASPLGGLNSALNEAQVNLYSGMDQDVEQQRDLGDAKAKRIEEVAKLQAAQAAAMEIDAKHQQQADQEAADKHDAFLRRNEELSADLAKQQIDPKRLFREQGTADKVVFMIGSVLGGALQGLRGGGPNEFLANFDKMIDRDINAQQAEVDNKKAALSARQNLFGQMLNETGDRRIAAMQSRNLMYEGMKQQLLSTADRLGIPEVKVNAEMGARAIQAKQDALTVQLREHAVVSFKQAAAAAAAGRAAAEKEAWKRSMEVAEFALKKDAQAIELAKLQKGDGDKTDQQVAELGNKLADPKLASGRSAVEALKGQLSGQPKDEGIPGVGLSGDVRSSLGWGLGNRVLLSDQERINRSDWNKARLYYQQQITGAGGSKEQLQEISEAFEGAKTAAEQRAAIARAEGVYNQVESRTLAAYPPEVQAEFKRRLAAQEKKK
jgi:hypothetical protein